VFAVGTIFGMSDMLLTNMDASHRAVVPTHVYVYLDRLVDRDTILSLKEVPGVEGVEPFNSMNVVYKLHPEDEWRQGVIQMRDDYNAQKYALLQLRQGRWPLSKNEIGLERMAAQFLNIGMGDTVIFKIDDQERTFPVTGLIRHPFVPPPQFMDLAFFFMNGEGMERLGFPPGKFSAVYMRVTPYSRPYSEEVATAVKEKLAKQGIGVGNFQYEDPEKHWGRTYFDAITQVQQVLALICVLISGILVFNTLSNLITQQVNQIGVLKAVGGRTGTIARVYMFSAVVYGLLAFLVALPLSLFMAYGLTKVFLNLFNIDFDQFHYSSKAILLEAICAIAVPLLAGLPPILKGAGMTVREAIASYGLGGGYRSGRLDRFVEKIGERLMSSHYATALGNMLRHKGRLIMTLVVLMAAGSSFLTVMSLNSSLDLTLDNIYARQRFDMTIYFFDDERADQVVTLAESVPGVEKAEIRLRHAANMLVAGQQAKEAGLGASVNGIPAKSDFFSPLMVAGRWLMPGEGRAVVITRETAEKDNIHVGDMVTLDLGKDGKDKWQVVGLYEPVFVGGFNAESFYVPQETLAYVMKKYNKGPILLVRTTSSDAESTAAMAKKLKEMYEAHGIKVSASETQASTRATREWQFGLVTNMLLALSVIIALVGGIALMGALSIGVIERTKEIGVLRAVGARSHVILGIFVMEGVLQGLMSWIIAVPISLVLSPLAASKLGNIMFGATLDYQYNWPAVLIWLGIVLMVSILASLLPARGATKISVRDSLAYA
jgi:putative ABC transport system permease protein